MKLVLLLALASYACALRAPRFGITRFGSTEKSTRRPTILLAAKGDDAESPNWLAKMIKPPAGIRGRIWFFSLYATGFTVLLVRTLAKFPLIPPSPGSLAWNAAWLWTTIADYYGAALALCGIIVASETRRDGILWSLGVLLLGCPFACFYLISRLLRTGTLSLAQK